MMPDQPPAVSLKEHLETQIEWLDRHVAVQLKAIDVNTDKALATLDERLKGMNEFRDALKDTTANQATKGELNSLKEQCDSRLKALELNKANIEGKVVVISGLVAFVASVLVISISRLFMP